MATIPYTPAEIELGREGLSYFHNASIAYPNYGLNFDSLLAAVGGFNSNYFLGGFGSTIMLLKNNNNFSTSDLRSAMQALAKQAQGRIPESPIGTFSSALSNQSTKFSFISAAKFTVVESAKTVASGAQSLGDTLITSAKIIQLLIPLSIVGVVIFIAMNPERAVKLAKSVR